ncbi:MAG: T9SS C-terminal target domain-containing protein [Chlorobi bacterium CHB2]|nr:T9SS C-terminal target domain-containing protein [Chlorobi bacterium CHB2]
MLTLWGSHHYSLDRLEELTAKALPEPLFLRAGSGIQTVMSPIQFPAENHHAAMPTGMSAWMSMAIVLHEQEVQRSLMAAPNVIREIFSTLEAAQVSAPISLFMVAALHPSLTHLYQRNNHTGAIMISEHIRSQILGAGLILLLLLPIGTLPAQQLGWEWLNPKPTGNSMYDVQMMTEQFGVAVGENGGMIATYDGGNTWEARSTGTSAGLHALHFRDSLHGVAGGVGLQILQTDDAGITWKVRNQGEANEGQIEAIKMLTPMVGVAVGGGNTTCQIVRTVDGGATWSPVAPPTTNPMYAMHFINAEKGWAVGAWNTVIHTQDGGATWTVLRSEGSGSGGGRRAELQGVFFIDSLRGFMTGITGQFKEPGYLYSTTDGGYSWSGSSRNFGLRPGNILFTTPTTGYVMGSGIMYRTTTSGKEWSPLYESGLPQNGIAVNGSTMVAVGSPASIYSSNDTGVTWKICSGGSTATFSSISFSTQQQGVGVGVGRDSKASIDSQITIYTTNNGGATWKKRPYPGQQILSAVACADGLCVAVGDSGTILRSADDGMTWTESLSGVKNYLNDVVVINRRNAVAVGRYATIVRTTDAGETWVSQQPQTASSLFGVSFADSLTGLAVGNPPKLLGTTDGGATWDSIPTYFTSMLGVQMHDHQTATRRGVTEVARTTDGGKTWTPFPFPAGVNPFRMSFWNARYGVVAPETGGTIYYTNDSGQTWSAEQSGLSVLGTVVFRMYGICMIDSLRAIVVGPNGAILRFTKSERTSSVGIGDGDKNGDGWGNEGGLLLYPNPTSGRVWLRLPKDCEGDIELYNGLGQQVAVGTWTQSHTGSNEVVMELNGLPSGLYVVQMVGKGQRHSVPIVVAH